MAFRFQLSRFLILGRLIVRQQARFRYLGLASSIVYQTVRIFEYFPANSFICSIELINIFYAVYSIFIKLM